VKKPSLTKQEQYLKIINDTVQFYKKNPRAVNQHGQCSYIDKAGNRCAVGRYISEEYIEQVNNSSAIGLSVEGLHNAFEIDTILVDTVQGLDLNFWIDLQNLHDSRAYWNGMELTTAGLGMVKHLRTKWAPNLFAPKYKPRTNK
jgi:hypothetical protein